MKRFFRISDPALFCLTLLATVIGMFFIFDAGYARSLVKDEGWIPRELRTQVLWFAPSLFLSLVVSRLNPKVLRQSAPMLWGIIIALLLLVAKIGTSNSGGKRWLMIGNNQFQPAEFAKVIVILYIAACFADRKPWPATISKRSFGRWVATVGRALVRRWMPGILLLFVFVLIAEEPDLGTAAVVAAIGTTMFIVGRVSQKSLIVAALVASIGVGAMIVKEPYRLERITKHIHRWDSGNADDIGFQTVQSEAAMAEGGLFGVGFGNGRAKHVIPATTNDFIMATVGEETGLFGVFGILSVLGAIVARLIWLGNRQRDSFASLVLYGTAAWIGIQACVNVMMSNGFLPAIGIPLPFISSGGSSLVALWLSIGACQSVVTKGESLVNNESNATSLQLANGRQNDEETKTNRDRRGDRRPRLSRA